MANLVARGRSGRGARQIAVLAARSAGEVVRQHYGVAKTVAQKGRANIGTEADLAAERAIVEILRAEFPSYGIAAEESGVTPGIEDWSWVVDPLDGTMNFSLGIPFFAVAIALVYRGEPRLGVIFDPLRRELFVAERGRGATLNGAPIRASATTDLATASVGFDLGYDEDGRQASFATAEQLRPIVQTLRILGSSVLGQAYVACGRLDLYFHRFLFPWDVAAARVLLLEAGAVTTELSGEPATLESRSLITASPRLHQAFLRVCAKPGLDKGAQPHAPS